MSDGKGKRSTSVRVKSAKGRTNSSTRWLKRQLNDPYVRRAKDEGYRSRAAFKLVELNDQFRFLKPGMRVLDLGAAPGGWCQVAARQVRSVGHKDARVLGIDLKPIASMPGVQTIEKDFL
jgi:23S rRNA methylase